MGSFEQVSCNKCIDKLFEEATHMNNIICVNWENKNKYWQHVIVNQSSTRDHLMTG
jgi:hypothetical protein